MHSKETNLIPCSRDSKKPGAFGDSYGPQVTSLLTGCEFC